MRRCSKSCRRQWIRAASAESSIRSRTRGRCSRGRFRSKRASPSKGTASYSLICASGGDHKRSTTKDTKDTEHWLVSQRRDGVLSKRFLCVLCVLCGESLMSNYPQRIVCLTEETTETLYLLGQGDRIVGVSGYTV